MMDKNHAASIGDGGILQWLLIGPQEALLTSLLLDLILSSGADVR